ncbi:hypothetical protein GLYMA_16G010466v4 [Glycine max]|nr:hypothetical protein GLYMA_16G010466v4 [Glycine max]KAG4379572.1 hypothetical protein GLYMA_16G010466v4 [Glycine max]KAH1149382.1 hypothetical protein GYH30_043779 [Glycine max]KAH1149383.1 hypothetical protein GYH30_043779 [Glycine max]
MAKTRPDAKASAGKKKKVLKKGPPSSQIAKRSQILHRKGPFSSQPAQVDYVATEDHLLTLPNTHSADLLAQQFCSLMVREGYVKEVPGSNLNQTV